MAEREELILEVEVDSGRAESDLEDVERAAKDVEDAVEEAGTAAERAGRAVVEAAEKAKAEMVAEKAAADALAQALGPELAAKADMTEVIAGLQKMGLSLDDIKAEAETLATSLKQVDDIRLQGLSQGVDITRQRMDGLTSSGNQSRSVLANLAGNSAQDIGNLGGVVGSLGVGIGQLAEYAVDGNIKLNQLASVAGPMLGLVVASQAVSTALAGIKAEAAFRADLVDDFTEALRGAETAAESILETIRETGELAFSDEGGFAGLGQQAEDLLPVLERMGLSIDDFLRLVQLSVSGSTEQLDAFFAELNRGHPVIGDFNADADALADGIDQYADSIKAAEEAQRIFNELMPFTGEAATAMLEKLREPTTILPDLWEALIEDAKDLEFNFENAAGAIDQLAAATGMEREEIVALVHEKASDEIQAQAEAAEKAAEAERDHAEALAETSRELETMMANFDDVALRADAVSAAFDELNQHSELTMSQEVVDFVGNLNTLHEALHEVTRAGIDLNEIDLVPDSWEEITNMPEELGPVQDALVAFRDSIQSEFAQAFEQGGSAEARQWAENTAAAVTENLHRAGVTSEDAVNQILSALGLLPDQVDIAINVSKEQEARSVLDSIASEIDQFVPPEIRLEVAALSVDDPIAALELAIESLQTAGVQIPASLVFLAAEIGANIDTAVSEAPIPTATVPTEADTTGAQSDLDDVTSDPPSATIEADADTIQAANDLLDTALEPRTATIVAHAHTAGANIDLNAVANAPRTANIDVNALLGGFESEMAFALRPRTVNVTVRMNRRIEGSRFI